MEKHPLTGRSWCRTRTLIGLVVVTGVAAATGLSPAGAATTFTGIAAAEGIRATFVAGGGPVTDTPVDGGSPVAQAALDSLGSSTAFASHLYPGDVVIVGPGTVAGATNGRVNLPEYPIIAKSDASTHPSSEVSGGGATLRAESTQDRSHASATAGFFDSPTARLISTSARAAVTKQGGGARSAAADEVNGFAAGAFVLTQVHSLAEVAVSDDGVLARRSELRITGASVGGTSIEIGPGGVMLGSSATPLPGRPPVGDLLRQSGVSLTYLAPQEIEGGIVAAGLIVRVQQAVPGPVTPVGVAYLLGRATARLGNLSSQAALPPATVPDDVAPADAVDAPADSGQPTAPLKDDVPSAPVGGVTVPGPPSAPDRLVDPGSPSPPQEVTLGTSGPSGLVARPAGVAEPTGLFDTTNLYLLVVFGGLLGSVIARMMTRTRKVSSSWSG